jgi:hypothetical protein
MAALSDSTQKSISAQQQSPSRSSAVGNTNNGIASVSFTDVVLNDTITVGGATKSVGINHRCVEYILTKPPTALAAGTINPNPGDRARVFYVDDGNPNTVTGYAEYYYGTANGATNGPCAWRLVSTTAA